VRTLNVTLCQNKLLSARLYLRRTIWRHDEML